MTTAVFAPTDWPLPPLNGFSVALDQVTKGNPRAARLQLRGMSPTSTDLYLSTGVSQSASIIQRMTSELLNDIQEWLTLSVSMPEVERDVVVLLPPNRRRVVTVHARYAGKALPLISLDDIFVEPGSD